MLVLHLKTLRHRIVAIFIVAIFLDEPKPLSIMAF